MSDTDPEGLAQCLAALSAPVSASQLVTDAAQGGSEAEGGGGSASNASGERLGKRAGAATPNSLLLGGAWSKELRSLAWIPAHTAPPLRHPDGLPWPAQIHTAPGLLAAPSQCCHASSMWLCSSTTRVSSAEVQSDLLRELLGWTRPISGRSVALQMLALSARSNGQDGPGEGGQSRAAAALHAAFPKLLSCLQLALDRESSREIDIWLSALRGKAVLWLGAAFVEPERVAFRALSSVYTEPYLYLVPPELSVYSAVLRRLGVKDVFGPTDLAGMMRELHVGQAGQALSPNKIEMCVGILRLLVRQLEGHEREDGAAAVAVASAVVVATSVDATGEAGPGPNALPSPPAKPPRPSPLSPPPAPAFVSLAELGQVFVPDSQGVLSLVTNCSYDDAPWISALLVQKGSSIRFTHPLLGPDALALGARSLRQQLFAGDEMVCPDAAKLCALLHSDGIFDALCDVLSLADALGAHSLNIMYDPRQHARESLMHPGLAAAQGRALLVHLDGPVLGSEEIAQSISDLPIHSYMNRERDLEERGYSPQCGKKLVSAFAVTDCLQIVSGREFFLIDPTGAHLLSDDRAAGAGAGGGAKGPKATGAGVPGGTKASSGAGGGARRPVGRAQRCFLVGAGNSSSSGADVLSRFPDQFEPFLSAPFGLRRALADRTGISGMILRLPLREARSEISAQVATEGAVKQALLRLVPVVEAALALGGSLMKVSILHEAGGLGAGVDAAGGGEGSDAAEFVTDTSMCLLSSPARRCSRRTLLQDQGWRRNALTNMFSPFSPPEAGYIVTLNTRRMAGWLNDAHAEGSATIEYLVLSTMGAQRIKEEALREPFRSFNLRPFATLAVRLLSSADMLSQHGPETGLFFSSGGAVGVSGLPFHCEGAFLQDAHERCVPLSEGYAPSASGTKTGGAVVAPRRALSVVHPKGPSEPPLLRAHIAAWNRSLLQTVMEALVPRMMHELTAGEASRVAVGNSSGGGGAVAALSSSAPRTQAAGFYKHWPFLSRMTQPVHHAALACRLLPQLAALPLFLTRQGFAPLEQTLLPSRLSSDILRYLQTLLPVCLSPEQLGMSAPFLLAPTTLLLFHHFSKHSRSHFT